MERDTGAEDRSSADEESLMMTWCGLVIGMQMYLSREMGEGSR